MPMQALYFQEATFPLIATVQAALLKHLGFYAYRKAGA